MKKSLIVAIVAACTLLVPALTHAQVRIGKPICGPTDPKTGESECRITFDKVTPTPRVVVDINYIGGEFISAFDYPQERTLESGKTYQANGIEVAAKVRITDVVSVGYRQEHSALRKAEFFSNGRFEQNEPDQDFSGGAVNYQELFGSFALPKTRGHRLLVGIAKANLRRESVTVVMFTPLPSIPTTRPMPPTVPQMFTVQSSIEAQQIAMLVGGEGSQRLGKVVFDYAGRLYPRMSRKDHWTSQEVGGGNMHGEDPDQSSVGWELRGTATWMLAKHVGITGGYQIRRLRTEVAPDSSWPINENQTTASVVVGTRLSF